MTNDLIDYRLGGPSLLLSKTRISFGAYELCLGAVSPPGRDSSSIVSISSYRLSPCDMVVDIVAVVLVKILMNDLIPVLLLGTGIEVPWRAWLVVARPPPPPPRWLAAADDFDDDATDLCGPSWATPRGRHIHINIRCLRRETLLLCRRCLKAGTEEITMARLSSSLGDTQTKQRISSQDSINTIPKHGEMFLYYVIRSFSLRGEFRWKKKKRNLQTPYSGFHYSHCYIRRR